MLKDDMLLCVQTEIQKYIHAKCRNNIVDIDSTHGTTMYDFLLISLIVLDEYLKVFQLPEQFQTEKIKQHCHAF